MTPDQSRMARTLLRWTLSELAATAKVGRATAARFELGEQVGAQPIAAMRWALESGGAGLIDRGPYAGGVFPAKSAPVGVAVREKPE